LVFGFSRKNSAKSKLIKLIGKLITDEFGVFVFILNQKVKLIKQSGPQTHHQTHHIGVLCF
jgi:hypothetical protein